MTDKVRFLLLQSIMQKVGDTPRASQAPTFAANPQLLHRLHKLERHMRENKLKLTFPDELGAAQENDELSSKREARKLAFYLYWNVRPNLSR